MQGSDQRLKEIDAPSMIGARRALFVRLWYGKVSSFAEVLWTSGSAVHGPLIAFPIYFDPYIPVSAWGTL
jgi:hypothetical protein